MLSAVTEWVGLTLCDNISVVSNVYILSVLLILASQRLESLFNISFGGGITQTKSDMRGSPPTLIEWMIIVYVAGKPSAHTPRIQPWLSAALLSHRCCQWQYCLCNCVKETLAVIFTVIFSPINKS